ncbi:MAG TPA: hypothetical protein PKA82_16955 [Pyrinomonadaceae bacterium]|nr:hypothetical protein [Pyrinomonadaceae bacterium]
MGLSAIAGSSIFLTWLQVGCSILFVILFPLKTLKDHHSRSGWFINILCVVQNCAEWRVFATFMADAVYFHGFLARHIFCQLVIGGSGNG